MSNPSREHRLTRVIEEHDLWQRFNADVKRQVGCDKAHLYVPVGGVDAFIIVVNLCDGDSIDVDMGKIYHPYD